MEFLLHVCARHLVAAIRLVHQSRVGVLLGSKAALVTQHHSASELVVLDQFCPSISLGLLCPLHPEQVLSGRGYGSFCSPRCGGVGGRPGQGPQHSAWGCCGACGTSETSATSLWIRPWAVPDAGPVNSAPPQAGSIDELKVSAVANDRVT